MKNYIIGYGSLINNESQNFTGKTFDSRPIWLKNHIRKWNVNYNDLNFCALGIYPEFGKKINAVLFTTEEIEKFDLREHGYTRVQIPEVEMTSWDGNSLNITDPIWTYYPLSEKVGPSESNHYIWQSYLDVILMGCLSFGTSFANSFLETTYGFDKKRINNDRKHSEYIKKLINYNKEDIDQIIKKMENSYED